MKILIVEDHETTAEKLVALLKKADGNLEITIAHNLADGITWSNANLPDVTLLDLCLPDAKDWRETVAAIPRFVPPVIVVSDLDDPEVKIECYKAGCENIFNKRTVFAIASVLVGAAASAKLRRLGKETHNG